MNEDHLRELTDELVTGVIRTAVVLEDVFASLLSDLPDEAFRGQDKAKVLFDLVVGSAEIATAAAGEEACHVAIALVGAIGERILADLHTAALLAMEDRDDS